MFSQKYVGIQLRLRFYYRLCEISFRSSLMGQTDLYLYSHLLRSFKVHRMAVVAIIVRLELFLRAFTTFVDRHEVVWVGLCKTSFVLLMLKLLDGVIESWSLLDQQFLLLFDLMQLLLEDADLIARKLVIYQSTLFTLLLLFEFSLTCFVVASQLSSVVELLS